MTFYIISTKLAKIEINIFIVSIHDFGNKEIIFHIYYILIPTYIILGWQLSNCGFF